MRLPFHELFPYPEGVNYFAHAFCYLDRPDFIAGLAVPDWLSVVNRRARVRRRTLLAELPSLPLDDVEIAMGILQHLDDDQWFHGTAAFFEATGELARRFRESLPSEEAWHCGFLGHIVLEMLIDGVLIENDPAALQCYYLRLGEVDRDRMQRVVSSLATQPVPDLAYFIDLFLRERFLEDYVDDLGLLRRLNQVMRRVGLTPLPSEVATVLKAGRGFVRARLSELLPSSRFPSPNQLSQVGLVFPLDGQSGQ